MNDLMARLAHQIAKEKASGTVTSYVVRIGKDWFGNFDNRDLAEKRSEVLSALYPHRAFEINISEVTKPVEPLRGVFFAYLQNGYIEFDSIDMLDWFAEKSAEYLNRWNIDSRVLFAIDFAYRDGKTQMEVIERDDLSARYLEHD